MLEDIKIPMSSNPVVIPNLEKQEYLSKKDESIDWKYSPFNHIKYSLTLSKDVMSSMGIDVEDREAITYAHSDGFCLVYINNNAECSDTDKVALICHEAVHVWQEIRDAMGEESPSVEFEAYSIQKVFFDLLTMYQEQI